VQHTWRWVVAAPFSLKDIVTVAPPASSLSVPVVSLISPAPPARWRQQDLGRFDRGRRQFHSRARSAPDCWQQQPRRRCHRTYFWRRRQFAHEGRRRHADALRDRHLLGNFDASGRHGRSRGRYGGLRQSHRLRCRCPGDTAYRERGASGQSFHSEHSGLCVW